MRHTLLQVDQCMLVDLAQRKDVSIGEAKPASPTEYAIRPGRSGLGAAYLEVAFFQGSNERISSCNSLVVSETCLKQGCIPSLSHHYVRINKGQKTAGTRKISQRLSGM